MDEKDTVEEPEVIVLDTDGKEGFDDRRQSFNQYKKYAKASYPASLRILAFLVFFFSCFGLFFSLLFTLITFCFFAATLFNNEELGKIYRRIRRTNHFFALITLSSFVSIFNPSLGIGFLFFSSLIYERQENNRFFDKIFAFIRRP